MPDTSPFFAAIAGGAAALAVAVPLAIAQPAKPLMLEGRIPLDRVKGRIDHMAVDLDRNRLIVAELGNDTIDVIDLRSRVSLRRIGGVREPQGVAYVAGTDIIAAASARDGTVHLFRGEDFAPVAVVRLGSDADNLRLDGTALVAGYGKGALAWIDVSSGTKTFDIPLPGHPEGFRLHPADGRVFVNIPDAGGITVVDRYRRERLAQWRVDGAAANFPMAIDERGDQIAAVFRMPSRLVLFDTRRGSAAASAPTCGDSDDVFFDPKRLHVYVSCGEGAVEVFEQNEDGLSSLGRIATSAGARTSLFVPELDRLFVAARATSSSPAAILVYRPSP
jgi:hypothetical protein